MYKAKDIESKVKLLHNIYFSSSSEMNLINIEKYEYS